MVFLHEIFDGTFVPVIYTIFGKTDSIIFHFLLWKIMTLLYCLQNYIF